MGCTNKQRSRSAPHVAIPSSCACHQRKAHEIKLLQQNLDAGKPGNALTPNAVKFTTDCCRPARPAPVLLGFRWSGYRELSDSELFYSPKPVMINLRRRNHRPFVACFCEHSPVTGVLGASPQSSRCRHAVPKLGRK